MNARRKVVRKLLAIGLALGIVSAMPSAASAQELFNPGPVLSVPNPTDIAYDPWDDVVYVSSLGPPPGVYVFDEFTGQQLGFTPLPADADPGAIDFDEDDNLVVIDRTGNRIFFIDAETGQIIGSGIYPVTLDSASGFVDAFRIGPVISDFGSVSQGGGLFYGFGFATEFPFGPGIHPNGVDLLPGTGKTKKGRLAAELLVIDAEHSQIHSIPDTGDAVTGSQVTGVVPGNPGLQPPRDISVSPVTLSQKSNGTAVHPVMVPIPDLGNVYWSPGPGGPFLPLSPTSFGRPVRVDADCGSGDAVEGSQVVGVTDFTNDKVSTFWQELPKNTECGDLLDIVFDSLTRSGQLKLEINALVDAKARVSLASFGGGETYSASASGVAQARLAKSSKRATLRAGRVKKLSLSLSGEAKEKLRRTGKLKGRLKIRLKSLSGRKVRITQPLRIKAR